MARILVTGGSGFIGSHIVEELRKNNHEVYIMDIICSTKGLNALADFGSIDEMRYYLDCDIRDFQQVMNSFNFIGPDYVIHCAARARPGNMVAGLFLR